MIKQKIMKTQRTVISHIEYWGMICIQRGYGLIKDDVASCFEEMVKKYMEELECTLLDMAAFDNHVILHINATPEMSPVALYTSIRNATSAMIREKSGVPNIWSRSMLISTQPINEAEKNHVLEMVKRRR